MLFLIDIDVYRGFMCDTIFLVIVFLSIDLANQVQGQLKVADPRPRPTTTKIVTSNVKHSLTKNEINAQITTFNWRQYYKIFTNSSFKY